jgi:hypothetical protein
VLARHHFIEEAPELARDKRDRVWKPVVERFQIDRNLAGAENAIDPYLRWLRAMFLRDREAPGTQEDFHEGTASGAFFTRDEAEQLTAEVFAVMEKWWDRTGAAKRADPDDPERKFYQFLYALGPRDLAGEPAPED